MDCRFQQICYQSTLSPFLRVDTTFAIVNHQGRYSSNSYRTPIMTFPTKDGFVFALTYGRNIDWIKNLISSNKGSLEYQGEVIEIHNIRQTSYNDVRKEFPFVIRFLLNIITVEHCLIVDKNTPNGTRA